MVTNEHFSYYTWPHLLVNVITDSTMNEITLESTSDSMARVTAGAYNRNIDKR